MLEDTSAHQVLTAEQPKTPHNHNTDVYMNYLVILLYSMQYHQGPVRGL